MVDLAAPVLLAVLVGPEAIIAHGQGEYGFSRGVGRFVIAGIAGPVKGITARPASGLASDFSIMSLI
jgi:hypothetical protein